MVSEQHSEFGRKIGKLHWGSVLVNGPAAVYQSVGTMSEGRPEGMVAIAF